MLKKYFQVLCTMTSLMVAGAGASQAADAYVSATVSGVLAPGVYGRIDIGNAPPPPVLYPQPVIITRPPVVVQQPPLYLYVPPGHAKNWRKHCARYNACDRPVYFANVDNKGKYRHSDKGRRGGGRNDHGRGPRQDDDHGRGHDDDHGKGRSRNH